MKPKHIWKGDVFTWGNNREGEGFVEEKLDRILGSLEWHEKFPKAVVCNTFRSSSDHSLLLLDAKPNLQLPKKRFFFDKRWLLKEDIKEVVETAWNHVQEGTLMFQLQERIKKCRIELLKWSSSFKTISARNICQLSASLEDLRKQGGFRDWGAWNSLKQKLDSEYQSEELHWHQKSRVSWLKEGDKNTKFFHALCLERRKHNSISRLIKDNNVVCEKDEEIGEVVTEYYHKLFSSDRCFGDFNLLEGITHSITVEMNKELIAPMDEKEIKQALFDMNPSKAPGPDGMSPIFFQKFWTIIKKDLCDAVLNFFSTGKILKQMNNALVTLIPKCPNPSSISQFRPISLCNVSYKIISKILANRLKICLPFCVSLNQSAFQSDRYILDNVVVAQEAFHFLNRHRSGKKYFMAIKLDMMKAYDRVEWRGLRAVMFKMGFAHTFVNWISACLTSSSLSFNINGSIKGLVRPSRGLRQGDPISPYLFLLISEIFSNLISSAAKKKNLKGLSISKNGPMITHLLFADDSIMFCEANPLQANLVMEILENYNTLSGQKVNWEKSSAFFSRNTPLEVQDEICQILGGIQKHQSSRYLGLPLAIGRSKKETFDYVVNRVQAKLCSWKNRFLSPAGKEVLIKAVIDSLPIYVMACFKLPLGICQKISQMVAKFWWNSGNKEHQGIHWKAWKYISVPKEQGGLGFHDIVLFNEALLTKNLWRIITKPNLLVSKVLKAKYFPNGNLLNVEIKQNASWLWRCWLGVKDVLVQGIRMEIGDGRSTRIWNSPWIPDSLNFKPTTVPITENALTWVHELISGDGRSWNLELLNETFNLRDCENIQKIKNLNQERKDRFFWHFEKKGMFSVKSTYSYLILKKIEQMDIAESSEKGLLMKKIRNRSWTIVTKVKIKHFIWKCFTGILPTNHNLRRKGIELDMICKCCGEEQETIEHIFFHCKRAKLIWKHAPIQWEGLEKETDSFCAWWSKICCCGESWVAKDRIQLTTYILWWLWKTRNLWIFEGCWKPEDKTVESAVNEWLEFQAVRIKNTL